MLTPPTPISASASNGLAPSRLISRDRTTPEGPTAWLRNVALYRLGFLLVIAVGLWIQWGLPHRDLLLYLYGVAMAAAAGHYAIVRVAQKPPTTATQVQVFLDLVIVGATIHFTNGPTSIFAFLLVMVVVESGLLLGSLHAFAIATVACVFMAGQSYLYTAAVPAPDLPSLIYNFCVQTLALFLTAFVTSYWSQRINRMQTFHREILDNMNSGFLIVDPHGIVRSLNKVGRRILNLKPGEGEGLPVETVLRMEPEYECPVLTALRSQRDFSSYEFRTLTAPGHVKLLGLTTSRLTDSKGRSNGLIASFTDLTEMAKLREELQRQDRMAVVGELAAGLAHEIRNPVAAIRGAADELASVDGDADLASKLGQIMIRESDHLNDIVSGFLDFARKPELKRETIDLREIVQDTERFLTREYAGSPSLHIKAYYPDEPCEILGDTTQLRQVFVNLGKNGLEAMGDEGRLNISVHKNGGPLEVRFEDEGPGIAPDEVSRIFEPFYTTKEKGVGMGLAVCHRIITAHDGSLRASSRETGGAVMQIILPAAGARTHGD